MYINWALYYIPKVFASFSYLVNPIFLYLIFTEKSNRYGNYRFLLLFFATFNVCYSCFTVFVPVDVHTYRYCFYMFINGGYFFESSTLGLNMLIARCGMISGSYAILLSHFLYRYLVVRNAFISAHFKLYMLGTVMMFIFFFVYWYGVGIRFAFADEEVKAYIGENFLHDYGENCTTTNLVSLLYNEASHKIVSRSWFTLCAVTVISTLSISLYIVFGTLTMRKLNENSFRMSASTTKLQKALLKSLIIQTIIPICVSYAPCVLCWYSPIFNINLGRGLNYLEVIALAAFPFCDPLAIILCLPVLRNRILHHIRPAKNSVQIELP
ncbi:Serpentine Receptor, class J [Caenorhabditis elegans]|uniref:Serpentine Receptor, class J n=1 Tax=Caenorhabditis elegans TaxID=6239 RepID=Q22283_CAEEL|nr:Serpentine Receptor, class J [Caenorhabditis elegans]CAA98289.1 Serpentine Receptor, class J [Caenorhabditis elegans]|eukprot:NP_505557.1 Serpentine Receptor, class J [Caenorhabditis elegans]